MVSQDEALRRYLARRHRTAVTIESLRELGGTATDSAAIKQFGYGRPLLVTYRAGGVRFQEVFHTIRRTAFGRERADDRVAAVWLDYTTFNRLPRHVAAVDMVAQLADGCWQSLDSAESLLLVTRFHPGRPYADDLSRLRDDGVATDQDAARVRTLARYLAGIHEVAHDDPLLWRRRLRDLVGSGEGIFGLSDSYPADLDALTPADRLQIEQSAVAWRWRLLPRAHRLRQVHGDFHPFNIIFDGDGELALLDRSRGEWGDPADDVSCLTINYIFFALQRNGRFDGALRGLHDLFWETYLAQRADDEMTAVIQPWLAWRALVLASPLWYPTIAPAVRRQLRNFALNVLRAERYAFGRIDPYLEEAP